MIVQISAYIASLLVLCGTIWKLSEKLESVSSIEARNDLAKWLTTVQPGEWFESISLRFSKIFDSIFGDQHLHWKCFLRSSIASLVGVAIALLIWIALRPHQLFESFEEHGIGFVLGIYFGFSVVTNFIPDYVSLLETRFAINYLKTNKAANVVGILVLDLIITIIIASTPVLFIEYLAEEDMYASAISMSTFTEGKANLGIFFYSTFFTSIWLWLFVFSSYLLRVSPALNKAMSGMRYNLNINEKPFLSLAVISIVLIVLIYIFSLLLLMACNA